MITCAAAVGVAVARLRDEPVGRAGDQVVARRRVVLVASVAEGAGGASPGSSPSAYCHVRAGVVAGVRLVAGRVPGAEQDDERADGGERPLAAQLSRLPATGLALVRAAEERERRPEQDLQVERGRAVLDVPDVELDPVGPRQLGPPVDLRPAGDPRLHVEPVQLALV